MLTKLIGTAVPPVPSQIVIRRYKDILIKWLKFWDRSQKDDMRFEVKKELTSNLVACFFVCLFIDLLFCSWIQLVLLIKANGRKLVCLYKLVHYITNFRGD